MIFKKKILQARYLSLLLKFIHKLIFYLGSISLIILLSIVIYYYSSGINKLFTPYALLQQINNKILNKYVGLDLNNIPEYFKILQMNITRQFTTNELQNVYLEIDQETILGLELQRKLRSENNGELYDDQKIFYAGVIKLDNVNYPIKLRTKGVRPIHWKDKDKTSYKVDIRGTQRLWGMEEFSIQKPIIRNYTYEYLFHNLLGHVGLLKINYFFVNLYINDQNLGVYAIEESFSKEIVERQKKRNGPIFSLKDELGEYFPNISYELYSENYWENEHPELIRDLYSILNNLREEQFIINNHFDIDKWAKYFAIMDLTGAYHGSLLKSVKLFYNPASGLFEPIGYDLHKGAGIFDNFILADFLQEETSVSKIECSYICYHKDWYLKFFKLNNGELNFVFIKKYIDYLVKYSSTEFIENFLDLHNKDLKKYNNAIYKDNSKSDRVRWVGAGYFVYDKDYLFQRANLIKRRINSNDIRSIEISKSGDYFHFEDYQISHFPFQAKTTDCENSNEEKSLFFAGKMSINLKTSCKKIIFSSLNNESKSFDLKENLKITPGKNVYFKNDLNPLGQNISFIKVSKNNYKSVDQVIIRNNSIIRADEIFNFKKGISINITNNSTLFVEGKINLENDEQNLTKIFSEDGTGSLIFINNDFNLKNMSISNLSKPNLDNFILYGGINFINSNVILENIFLNNSKNEDGINIVNSKSNLSNIYFENIMADAFDVDFGELNFSNIYCVNVQNDCLDISGAIVNGNFFKTENIQDKSISVGESSIVKINDLNIINSNVAIAVKDGSKANFSNIFLNDNNLDIVLFNKKQEFLKPSLSITNINELNEEKILQSKNTKLNIDNKKYLGSLDDNFINSIIY